MCLAVVTAIKCLAIVKAIKCLAGCLTETRGSGGAQQGARLFMAGPRACTDSQYGQYGQSVRTTFKP